MIEVKELIGELGALSYVGVFGVSLIANVVIPVPEEIILLAFGYLAGAGKLDAWIVIPIVVLGLFVSDMVMYTLSKKGNKIITYFYEKFFAPRIVKHKAWIEAHIHQVIFFSRFLIQLRFLGPFMAGQTRVPTKTFIKYDLAAIFVYVPLFIFFGWYFRNRIEFIISGVGMVKNAIIIGISIAILIAFSRFMNDLIFGSYTLAFHGAKEERTWIPWLYKIKKEE